MRNPSGEVNFAIIANRDMGNFVRLWRSFRISIHISTDMKLYIVRRMCGLGLPFMLSWFRSKMLMSDEFMGQLLSNIVRMPKYGHTVFGS